VWQITRPLQVIQNHLEEFVRYFKWSLISREEFQRLQRVDESTLTDIQRAARFYYLIRNAFGAKIVSHCYGVATSSKPRLNLLRLEEDLSETHLRLSRVSIENLPYDQLIKRYDSKGSFLYCDPPYWNCENDYGKNLFTKEDFTQLRDVLAACQGKWLVSINNVPQIKELFNGYEIKEVKTSYSINNGNAKPVTELLIANYKLDNM
jgi:DNA adenine methylase